MRRDVSPAKTAPMSLQPMQGKESSELEKSGGGRGQCDGGGERGGGGATQLTRKAASCRSSIAGHTTSLCMCLVVHLRA